MATYRATEWTRSSTTSMWADVPVVYVESATTCYRPTAQVADGGFCGTVGNLLTGRLDEVTCPACHEAIRAAGVGFTKEG